MADTHSPEDIVAIYTEVRNMKERAEEDRELLTKLNDSVTRLVAEVAHLSDSVHSALNEYNDLQARVVDLEAWRREQTAGYTHRSSWIAGIWSVVVSVGTILVIYFSVNHPWQH